MLVHDDSRLRERVRTIVEATSDMALISESSEIKEAPSLVDLLDPDVLILDGEAPESAGMIRSIVSVRSHIVPVTIGSADETISRPLFRAGALANIELVNLEKLPEAVRRALRIRTEIGFRPTL